MFDLGLREMTGDFDTINASGAATKVHAVATMRERDGGFDGVYAQFFTDGFFVSR
jgi:hypothetical protein